MKNTYDTIDGHVQESSRTDDCENPIDEFEDGNHHLIFILWSRPER